ncbi:hypothetical protein [Variovorax sp. J22R115]|uniref:hypothetical protein n=1 Tax=Variovorax sp. J22R115 TaxID=3053509 RepID=UPI0025761C54|nr:hypothetical protein [Variovorax sp. J22R115]MDM0047940.1 hypothetical protein [Variovorax sp. J22R115]
MSVGELSYHFHVTLIVGVLVLAFVQWRYRVAVLAGMASAPGDALAVRGTPAASLASLHAIEAIPNHEDRAMAWERTVHRRVIAGWLLSVGVASVLLAITYLASGEIPVNLARVSLTAGVYLCAVVPMVGVSLAWPWPRGALFGVALLAAGAATTVGALLLQRSLSGEPITFDVSRRFLDFLQLAAVVLALPMFLILGSGVSRFRGVVPITFAGLLVFGTAPFLGVQATRALADSHAGGALILGSYGLFGHLAWHLTFLAVAVPVGWVAWKRLHVLARAYEHKRFSDVQLLARAWWLMLVASVASGVGSSEHAAWGAAGCVATYVVFVFISVRVFGWLKVTRDAPPPRNLLLLRVFGDTARTGRLFDRIGNRWRYFGPVSVIAAPDVVARTIDPGDYLHYMLGTVDETFVRSAADLQRRLDAQDTQRDPDGRFRINEFCCADTTWQATVVELMIRADAIVMDLRGISHERRGCEYELRQLATFVAPQRVVLVVDDTTEVDLVRSMLGPASQGMGMKFRKLGRSRLARTDDLFRDLLRAAH